MDESFRSSLLKDSTYNFTSWRAIGKSRINEKRVQGSSCQFSVNKALLTITERRDTSQCRELPVTESAPSKCGWSVGSATEGMLKWIGGWSVILKYPVVIRLWA